MRRRNGKIHRNPDGFREIVRTSRSIQEVRQRLGYKESGGFYKYFRQIVRDYGIDVSHFTGQLWSKGKTIADDPRIDKASSKIRWPLEKILINKTEYRGNNQVILRRLVKEGIKKYKCEKCNISEWMGKPLTLQLEHVNGDNMDYRIENLQFLCPNCHSQTCTFSKGLRIKNAALDQLEGVATLRR